MPKASGHINHGTQSINEKFIRKYYANSQNDMKVNHTI